MEYGWFRSENWKFHSLPKKLWFYYLIFVLFVCFFWHWNIPRPYLLSQHLLPQSYTNHCNFSPGILKLFHNLYSYVYPCILFSIYESLVILNQKNCKVQDLCLFGEFFKILSPRTGIFEKYIMLEEKLERKTSLGFPFPCQALIQHTKHTAQRWLPRQIPYPEPALCLYTVYTVIPPQYFSPVFLHPFECQSHKSI